MKYSLILLLEEENQDFFEFLDSLHKKLSSRGKSFEILIGANGTGGFLQDILNKVPVCSNEIRAFELSKKTAQSICLKALLKESNGEIIIVCGSYQQITIDSFFQLIESLDQETDIISAWRQNRVDPWFNRLQSKIFNGLVRKITKTSIHDLSCTVRVFRRKVLEEMELYGDMYRFLPIFAERRGFKTKEVRCEHHQEQGKTGFYSLSSYLGRIIDIFILYFNTRFSRKPLRFFTSIGIGFMGIGILMAGFIFVQKLLMEYPIGGRPGLLLSVFLMVIGIQTASVGLLGEIIAFTHGRHKKEYVIDKVIS